MIKVRYKMHKRILLIMSVLCLGFVTSSNIEIEYYTSNDTDIPILNFDALEPLLYAESEDIQIVNFWAMWCAPCVKELPVFQEYQRNNPNVKVTLVSLDFPEDVETKLKPFLKKKGITSKVILLDDPDSNSWIDKIDPNWSGAIPFTIIFNSKNRSFHERTFNNITDLKNEINTTINNK
ncbi:TlpA disulfide reductase family protein [Psychroserpens ponticola]|uniref:TlpA disulfide reductase family protein n=1 Tax=Psychroserpens ponticola TaxID=2932268 RepID=A0ABY7S194_9FLAO|nr:TlpA disulfide reductase family protein [Psychroserpens ponticola]WCO03159.1 TlpA disulfide reductase family protein [Psychroserpens ponticola]